MSGYAADDHATCPACRGRGGHDGRGCTVCDGYGTVPRGCAGRPVLPEGWDDDPDPDAAWDRMREHEVERWGTGAHREGA